ncbi:MAG: hypothetical protein ABJN84_06215 [Flavobacteriaceae bacterium]
MKLLTLLVLFLLGNSCNEADQVPYSETSQSEEASPNENTGLDQQLLGPNEIIFKIKVIGTLQDNKNICGVTKPNIYQMEVMEVMALGSSLNQKISKQQQMGVTFLFDPGQLENDLILEAKAKESLCPDASSTYFTIIGHEIVE